MKKKRHLTKQILVLLLIGVLFGTAILFADLYFAANYKKNTETSSRMVLEDFFSRYDLCFSLINRELGEILITDQNALLINGLNELNAEDAASSAFKRNVYLSNIQNLFKNMVYSYGSDYYFWFYSPRAEAFVDYGTMDYTDRRDYRKKVVETLDADASGFRLSRYGQWFITEDNYLETRHARGGIYIGAFIPAENVLLDIMNLELSDPYQAVLKDRNGNILSAYKKEDGLVTAATDSPGYRPLFRDSLITAEKAYGDYLIEITVYSGYIDRLLLVRILITVIWLIFLLFLAFCSIYVIRKILHPLIDFSDKISQYSEDTDFSHRSQIKELFETEELINRLAGNIRDLKLERYESELKRQSLELSFMQQQIRPHFYINCLNVLYSMAEIRQTEEIQELCLNISGYIRGLFRSSMELVSLGSELDMVDTYTAIICKVYGQEFDCSVSCPDELRSIRVPVLTIQTFVENSIKYARKGSLLSLPVSISVSAEMADERSLVITIQDSGQGFPEAFLKELQAGTVHAENNGHHVGIQNVLRRLQLLYKGDAALEMINNETGALVRIQLPVNAEQLTVTPGNEAHEYLTDR